LSAPSIDRLRPVGARPDHAERRRPLAMTIRQRQAGIHQQAAAFLHQAISHEARLRLLALPFAVEPTLGIGGRGMRVVRSFSSWDDLGFADVDYRAQ
jgi:hypothetical protein